MAYAALVSLVQTVDLILNYHEDAISPQVKDQIVSIVEYVIFLQMFLEHFPEKATSLEAIIRAATHVAEDTIELFMSEYVFEPRCGVLQSSVSQQTEMYEDLVRDFLDEANSLERRIGDVQDVAEVNTESFKVVRLVTDITESFIGPSKSEFRHEPKGQYEHLCYDFHGLKEAMEEIEFISAIVMKMKNRIVIKDERRREDPTAGSSSSRAAPVHKDAAVGSDDEALEIKTRLCGESPKLEVVPILGMGGIGKTTLARTAYDDLFIVNHFDIRGWVTVSQDYGVDEIVSGLLISMKMLDAKNELMRAEHVYRNLKGRRYLIVLDNIWSTEAWDDLKMMFPDDKNGSRIMLTTRLTDVASYPDSFSPVHEMRLMDEDQSWDLLRQKVFKQDPCPVELQNVGKEISRSCRGLPLAIVVISGLLSVDQTETAWKNVSENIRFALSANDEQFDKILSVSYANLPRHLRPCFLYMGGFPEDHEMRVSKLIKLWVAEGFVKPNGCNKTIEETAEEYLEDLVRRSLILVTKRKSNGRIKCFILHDLMREMCARKAQEENFIINLRFLPEGIKAPRRLTVFHDDLDYENFNCSTIRTIITLDHGVREARCSLGYFRLLRILDLSDAYDYNNFRTLPAQVFELFHLRYLAFNLQFSNTAAISNLQNLQTLIISSSTFVPMFILETLNLPHLRHLVVSSGLVFCLPRFQGQTFTLENLHTLSEAVNFICTREILKTIPNLKKLRISYMACNFFEEGYQLHNLIHLQHLENLKLKICKSFRLTEKVDPTFPTTLKKLTLSGLGFPWKDLNIVGSLPKLEVLKLRDHACIGNTWETTEAEFSQLEYLLIDESELQLWITGNSGPFPKLKSLVLRRCWDLTEIPDAIGEIPTLELIEVDDENKSLVDSVKQIQDEQRRCGDDVVNVRFVRKRWS